MVACKITVPEMRAAVVDGLDLLKELPGHDASEMLMIFLGGAALTCGALSEACSP